jgi:hypothetical protein
MVVESNTGTVLYCTRANSTSVGDDSSNLSAEDTCFPISAGVYMAVVYDSRLLCEERDMTMHGLTTQ